MDEFACTSKARIPAKPTKHAILHLQPSVRQTVVKTITTTTINYAPITLSRPPSPQLTGDYALDRHSRPLQLADEIKRVAVASSGNRVARGEDDNDAQYNAPSPSEEFRQFSLEFGHHGQGQSEPIKAVYTLDDAPSQDGECTLHTSKVDSKGKGKAVQNHALDAEPLPAIAELKRKRRVSDAIKTGGTSVANASSQVMKATVSGSSSSSSDSSSDTDAHPARKKQRPITTTVKPALDLQKARLAQMIGGLPTPDTSSSSLLEFPVSTVPAEASSSRKGKGRAVAASETVLPSPTLSPNADGGTVSTGLKEAEAIAIEKQLVRYNTSRSTSPSQGVKQQITSSTRVERIVEGDDGHEDDERRLACLAEGYTMSTLMSLPSLVSEFSSLSDKLQTNILYQLLRQSSTPVIQNVNHIIQPALKRDFISDLPAELSLQVMAYLDADMIMRCLLVSKNWKRFIDSQGQIWSMLLKEANLWVGGESETSSGFLEDEEASYWETAGVTKNAFYQTKSHTTKPASRKNRSSKGRSKSRSRERESGETGAKELSIGDLLSVSDWKTALFLKRWKAHTWDESFDAEEAARPTAEKLAALAENGGQPTPHRTNPRLRHANTRPRIGEYAPRIGYKSPPSAAESLPSRTDYIHPFKLIYKKRMSVRSHWFSPEPAATAINRCTFRGTQKSVITNLQFDNEKIVTASDDPTIDVYDTLTGNIRTRLEGHDGGIWALQYVGNVLVSGSTDRTVRVWDIETGICTHVFYGHTSTVRCLQIVEPVNVNPDPNGPPVWEPPYPLIVTGSRDWTLRVWRLPYPTRSSSLLPYCPPSPSDEQVDPENNAYHLRVLRGHGLAVRALAAHGRTLVSGSYDSYLRIWDLLSGECKHKLVGHSAKVYSVALDTARNRCASGSMDGSVRIWSIETGESLFRLDGHSSLVGLLGCSYHFLVSAGADSTLKVWDPATGTCIDTLSANAGAITCFKHDDFRIVSGCEGQLRVWDIRKGDVVKDVVENMQGVWQLQFSDRFCVAAVSREGGTDFEILDFFPELRDENRHHYDAEFGTDGYASQEYEYEGEFDDNAGPFDAVTDDENGSTLPSYEFPASQASMYQTPRQASTSTQRHHLSRKHGDPRYQAGGMEAQAKKHHHHHHHRHHHHHAQSQSVETRSTRSSLYPDQSISRGRNLSHSGSTLTSSFIVAEEAENLEELFAYSANHEAGPSGQYVEHYADAGAYAGPSDAYAHTSLDVGAALADYAEGSQSKTPDVKMEEEDDT